MKLIKLAELISLPLTGRVDERSSSGEVEPLSKACQAIIRQVVARHGWLPLFHPGARGKMVWQTTLSNRLAIVVPILTIIAAFFSTTPTLAADTYISVSISKSTAACPDDAGYNQATDICLATPSAGQIATGSHTVTTSTNNTLGYYVTISSPNDNTDMLNSTSTGNNSIHTLSQAGPLTGNAWGYKLSNDTDTYLPIPPLGKGDTIMESDAPNDVGAERAVYFGVSLDNSADNAAGQYTGQISYTATGKLPVDPSVTAVTPNTYELCDNCPNTITITGNNFSTITGVYIDTNSNQQGDTAEQCTDLKITTDTSGDKLTCNVPTLSINPDIPKETNTYNIIIAANSESGTIIVPTSDDRGFTYTYTPVDDILSFDYTDAKSGDTVRVDLDGNMVPVVYTGSETEPQWTTLTWDEIKADPTVWFNYANKQWANAVTVNCNALVKYRNQHKILDESDVKGYWTYIPRYDYQVMAMSSDDPTPIEQNFTIRLRNADKKAVEPSQIGDWATHPAFRWGTAEAGYKEQNGVWMGKFQMTDDGILPLRVHSLYNYDKLAMLGVYDPNNTTVSTSSNTQNSQQLRVSATHQTKDSEWGAAAYLASSEYGYGALNIQKNTSADYLTGCGPVSDCKADASGQYFGLVGRTASTTGNPTGIYDMSSNGYEQTASIAKTSYEAGPPYVDLYPDMSSSKSVCSWQECGGRALYETNGWGLNSGSGNSIIYSSITPNAVVRSKDGNLFNYQTFSLTFAQKERLAYRATLLAQPVN